jgi:hypothetical protein
MTENAAPNTSEPRRPPPRRRWPRRLALAALVVVALCGVLWLARLQIAERVIAGVLEARGVDQVSLAVDALDFNEARISNVKLGHDAALTVASVAVAYTPADLLAGRVHEAVVTNLTLAMTLDPAGVSFGSLDKLLAPKPPAKKSDTGAEKQAEPKPAAFDRIEIRDSYIRASSPYGPLAVAFGGDATGAPDGSLKATASLDLADSADMHLPGTLELAIAPAGTMTGQFRVAGGAFAWGPVSAQALSGLASFKGKGGIDELHIAAEIADFVAYDSKFREARATLDLGDSAGALSVRATDAAGALGLAIDGKGRLDAKSVVARLDISGHGTADAVLWRRLGLPPARTAKGALSLTLSGPRDDLAGDLSLALDADSLDLPDLALTRPDLRLSAGITLKGQKLALTLRPDGRLKLAAAHLGAVDLTAPATLPVAPGDAPLLSADLAALDKGDVAIDARLGAAPVRGTIAGAGKAKTPFAATLPTLAAIGTLDRELDFAGALTAKGGRVALPGYAVAIDGIDATVALPLARAKGPVATLAIATLRQTAERPALPPLKAEATVTAAGGAWAIGGHIQDSSNRLAATLAGRHDPATGQGAMLIAFSDIAFAKGGLQPRDLFPALRTAVTDASGTLGLKGEIGWNAKGASATARLLIKDFSATVEDITVQRVNTVLDFDSTRPRAARQDVAIALLDVGVPLTDGVIGLRIQPDFKINIDEAAFRLTGGRVYAKDEVYDPAATHQRLTLNVEGVSLGDLLQMTELEGLTATGTLAGRIPVDLQNGEAVIQNGVLSTGGPGVLRYKPATVPAALQGGGQGVDLMLQALTDFHYSALSLSLDRAADGETKIGLHLKGNNPAVYNGYPLEFNLNLSGKLDRILRDSLKGYRVPDTIQRKMLEFGK